MASLRPMLVLPLLVNCTQMAQEAKVTTLMSKDLTEFPGKEGMMIMVDYPPGSSDPVHRHNAQNELLLLAQQGFAPEGRFINPSAQFPL